MAMLRERMERGHRMRGEVMAWGEEITPAELFLRNFWFCSIEEPRSLEFRDHIGVDRIMLEVDYPHADTSWPDTQAKVHEMVGQFPPDDIRKMTHENAAHLYRHAIPTDPAWAR